MPFSETHDLYYDELAPTHIFNKKLPKCREMMRQIKNVSIMLPLWPDDGVGPPFQPCRSK